MQVNDIQLLHGDCLQLMNDIPDKSIDMILCDLPYGVLNKGNPGAKWDSVIPFDDLWKHYTRITKDNSAIVLFGSGMFTSNLMQSQKKLWKYNLVWDKVLKTGFLNANRMPLRQHEDICVFYKKLPVYHPQMIKCEPHRRNHGRGADGKGTNNCYGEYENLPPVISDEKFPTSIITIPKQHLRDGDLHPTQKPVALLEWLIKTYTDRGGSYLTTVVVLAVQALRVLILADCLLEWNLTKSIIRLRKRDYSVKGVNRHENNKRRCDDLFPT